MNWRNRFPIFNKHPSLIYLDNAATTQRLDTVMEVMHQFSLTGNANVHRGIYSLSNKATEQYEEVRKQIAAFLNAKNADNIGFTKGATEAINMVANGYLKKRIAKGDNVIVSILEHHANFLPWQELCNASGAKLRILPMDSEGRLSPNSLDKLIDNDTKMVALNHISNTLGRVNPIDELVKICKRKNVPVLVDAAQSVGLHQLDVEQMGCDFLAFSGHKLFGPMGTGVLYVSDQYRNKVGPLLVGGGMIASVNVHKSTYRDFPYNLEAGTPNVQGILGMGAAIKFLMQLDRKMAVHHLGTLMTMLTDKLKALPEVKVLPYFDVASGIVSFNVDDIHAHDVSGFLNRDNIAVRAGMHCTQPLMDELNLDATVRVSFSIYNQEDEVAKLIDSVKQLIAFWK